MRIADSSRALSSSYRASPVVLASQNAWLCCSSSGLSSAAKRSTNADRSRSREPVTAPDEFTGDLLEDGWISAARRRARGSRSEEHTSELQSRFGISYAVFCLNKK